MGYGSKALQLLVDYYEGKFANLSEDMDIAAEETITRVTDAELANASLLEDNIKIRDQSKMPPLFSVLSQRRPVNLDYIGVSYGLTQPLHKFWKRSRFAPVYLRQTANDLTGEHTAVMIRPLEHRGDMSWLGAFSRDFHRRFMELLSYQFRTFSAVLALSIDESANAGAALDEVNPAPLTKRGLDECFTPHDLKRLNSYASNVLDYHVILDLIPRIAELYFQGRIKSGVKLTGVQQSILLSIGLQRKDMDAIAEELSLPSSQLLAMFIKILRKITAHFDTLVSQAYDAEIPHTRLGVSLANATGVLDDEEVDTKYVPLQTSLEQELAEEGDEALKEVKRKQRELIDSLPLDKYVDRSFQIFSARLLHIDVSPLGTKLTMIWMLGERRKRRSRVPSLRARHPW